MILKNLVAAIEKNFGPFVDDRIKLELVNAAREDYKTIDSADTNDKDWIIVEFNKIFDKNSRVMSAAVSRKYKTILKHFSKAEITAAMQTAKNDEYHKQTNYKYCTIEYFSRIDQVDKWLTAGTINYEKNKNQFVLPTFNLKG